MSSHSIILITPTYSNAHTYYWHVVNSINRIVIPRTDLINYNCSFCKQTTTPCMISCPCVASEL